MGQRIIHLYDEYTHKPLSRKEFLTRLAKLAGGMAAATTLLPLLETGCASAAKTQSNDLFTEYITYPGVNGATVKTYVARRQKAKRYAAVVVIYENRGLNAHIEDAARRAAQAGVNDTSAARYNEAAAKLAWQCTLAFFEKNLGGEFIN